MFIYGFDGYFRRKLSNGPNLRSKPHNPHVIRLLIWHNQHVTRLQICHNQLVTSPLMDLIPLNNLPNITRNKLLVYSARYCIFIYIIIYNCLNYIIKFANIIDIWTLKYINVDWWISEEHGSGCSWRCEEQSWHEREEMRIWILIVLLDYLFKHFYIWIISYFWEFFIFSKLCL